MPRKYVEIPRCPSGGNADDLALTAAANEIAEESRPEFRIATAQIELLRLLARLAVEPPSTAIPICKDKRSGTV